jgi:2-hydroxychromene-2-carboxylate isomerase
MMPTGFQNTLPVARWFATEGVIMARTVQFYFDFISPYSYLAFTQLPRLRQQYGVDIEYVPIGVLALMAEVGNRPTTVECAAKGRYARIDLARWSQAYRVAFTPNPHFRRIDSRALLDGAASAIELGEGEGYVRAVFDGVWVRQAVFADDTELGRLLETASVHQVAQILSRRSSAHVMVDNNVAAAVAAGVFGVPSFICGSELYFGNARLSFLEQALAG